MSYPQLASEWKSKYEALGDYLSEQSDVVVRTDVRGHRAHAQRGSSGVVGPTSWLEPTTMPAPGWMLTVRLSEST
jgi:hypothetical protein